MPFKKTRLKDPQFLIGRADHLHFFVHDILRLDDPGHNIISISGQGGVGKSTLLRRFLEEARLPEFREYCLTAWTDERQATPAGVMERLAEQFREGGHALKKFEDALTRYKEALRRMQAAGYRDEQEQLVREVVETAGTLAEEIPFAGGVVHKGTTVLSDLVLEKGRMRQFLKDAARLEDPIGDLTSTFVRDLNALADTLVPSAASWNKRPRRILLFFDTFEQLASDIAPWLLDYFLEQEVSANIVLVIAGRDSLESSLPDDPKRWLPHLDSGTIHRISLKAFTEEETQLYLANRGITDPEKISQISQLSRGLPLYLSMLTTNAEGRIDPTASVVENFLRWIPRHESQKRQLALNAALFSLPFTKDDLAAFSYAEPERSELYRWISGQPFVLSNPQDGRHTYHDEARGMFRRDLYQRSPEEYYTARRTLARYYQQRLTTLQDEGGDTMYSSHPWQELAIALIQQVFLLPDEDSHLLGIAYVLRMYEHSAQDDELIRVLKTLAQESDQQVATHAQLLARQLLQYIEENTEEHYQHWLSVANALLERVSHVVSFPSDALAYLHRQIGRAYRRAGEYQPALEAFNRAILLLPNHANSYSGRGETYRLLKNYTQALADFDKAIALDDQDDWDFVRRGRIYHDLKRYEEALLDFGRAIALDEKYTWAVAMRGETYRLMGRYEDAVVDSSRAIALDEKYSAAFSLRGEIYRNMKRYEEALEDFGRAIALDEKDTWALARRGQTYQALERYEDALVDFDRAIALDEKSDWIFANRGETYRLMKRYEEALADFDKAIALNENYTWALASRGETYRLRERYEEALLDFDRAIALDEKNTRALARRGETYRLMKRYEEALADFDRAIALDEKDAWALVRRGQTYRALKRYEEALVDFDRAIALDEKNTWVLASRGEMYRLMERYEEALADFDKAIALDEKSDWAIAMRGETYRLMGHYKEALADFDKAIALDEKDTWALARRGQTYQALERYEEALADFDRAIALNEKYGGPVCQVQKSVVGKIPLSPFQ